ncbi:MAG: N-acetyltransferase [Acholeplasmatales bacterium]|nr:N-acetyltransferase [Acholeplasmatales bacterium]
MINIRDVKLEDSKRILEIYEYYIKNTAITFEITVPTILEFQERVRDLSSKFPYIVLTVDDKVVGYAYSHIYYGREAFKYSHEVTIYIDNNYKKQGFGKLLYAELEKRLKARGIINLYASVAICEKEDSHLNNNSLDFHKHLGYKEVGHFKKTGYKFDTWYDLVWLEKKIGNN